MKLAPRAHLKYEFPSMHSRFVAWVFHPSPLTKSFSCIERIVKISDLTIPEKQPNYSHQPSFSSLTVAVTISRGEPQKKTYAIFGYKFQQFLLLYICFHCCQIVRYTINLVDLLYKIFWVKCTSYHVQHTFS